MGESIVVVCGNKEECQGLCSMLKEWGYPVTALYSFQALERYLEKNPCLVAVLDLSSLAIDNRRIRDATIKNPGVYFLGTTSERLNPELKDAICYHIYACLNKPVDPDELAYWLRCIHEDQTGQKNTPLA